MKRTVIRADVYGLCTGVRRAIDLALEAGRNKDGDGVYTLGQLVHNSSIMEMLEAQGVREAGSPDEVSAGTVVIRAHGAPAGTAEGLERRGVSVVDATCPKVARSHAIIQSSAERGYLVIVAGERNHDEVVGLVSRAKQAIVVESAEEAEKLDFSGPAILIAQTTFRPAEYKRICDVITHQLDEVKIYQTICPSMENRCDALERLMHRVEAIAVIGGKNSANTRRLYEQACRSGLSAWHIEDAADLPDEIFSYTTIGITAGASTPDYIIQQVQERLESDR